MGLRPRDLLPGMTGHFIAPQKLPGGGLVSDWQHLFNIAAGLVGAGLGWWLNTVWNAVHDLQNADRDLADKVGRIEILVAGDYVRKADFADYMRGFETRMVARLDRIDDKLDSKADRKPG
jgi:uncharacterized membrane protein YeaQ/YmgE (transglycosylase-associated protein family)